MADAGRIAFGARGKIHDLEDLGAALASLQTAGKKVVHCHGVFDLLHIGHIRYFEQAKKLGDVLVVTVTPDRYVEKGPHRPAFDEELRMEAVAALACVDYVALNRWPTAVETIRLLRPNVYAKGPDYRDPSKDRTGAISLETTAIQSVGGEIAFTDAITFSSSRLVNRHMDILPKEARDYLDRFTARYGADDVLRHLDDIRPVKVLTVGEAIVDEYQYCEAIGKSAKEPMLAVKYLSSETFAGGILAVANNVANFCDRVSVVTMLGEEDHGEAVIVERLNSGIGRAFLRRRGSPTIVKRRFIEQYFFTKLLEVYEMNDEVLDPEDNRALCATLEEQIPKHDVVVVVDFGHGMLTPEAIEVLCTKAPFLAINAQSNAGNLGYHFISRYPRADYICMAEHEIRLEARDRRGDLHEMIREVSNRLSCNRVIVTRGKYGCVGYDAEAGMHEIPAFATQIVDRVGAGDAFLSITAPCVYRGAPMEIVGVIGNALGAQAVATVGHRTSIQRVPFMKYIEALLK